MAEKKEKVTKEKTKEFLKCMLTTEELLAYGERMADAQDEAMRLQSQFDSIKKEYNGKIEARKAEAERLGGVVRAKYEHREVECEVVTNYTKMTVTVTRLDTGVVEKSRRMTAEEASRLPLDAEEQ